MFISQDSRFSESSSTGAADEQTELLGEENPGDLLQRGAGPAFQIQDGRPQKSNAQSKAEEHTPVCQGMLTVPFEKC